jgi:hypothetical protein
MIKTSLVHLVRITNGVFQDTVISFSPTAQGAIADGLRYYRSACAHPERPPTITAEPTQAIGKRKR